MPPKIIQRKDVPIEQLFIAESNAKLHPDEQVTHIANSILEFGFVQPIVADEKGELVVGAGRYLALKKLGRKTVPSLWTVHGATESQIAAMRVVDNKLNADTGWIKELLNFEMEHLAMSELDLEALSLEFSPNELFDKPAPPKGSLEENMIKSIVMRFPNGVYEQVVQALHAMMEEIPGVVSNTDAFLWLLSEYGEGHGNS